MQTPSVCVGIDVSKTRLDVAMRPTSESLSVPYDDPGISTVLARLNQVRPIRIVLEATGGWNGLCCARWWTRPCR